MELLEKVPSTPAEPRPPGKTVWATMSISVLLVVAAAYFGYATLTGDDGEDDAIPVQMSKWLENATSTCLAVAEEYPVLTKGASARLDPDNIEPVDAGIRALVTGIRDLPQPDERADQDSVNAVVALGDPVDDAWQGLQADSVSDDELANASDLTTQFVTGLVDLGADCAVLN